AVLSRGAPLPLIAASFRPIGAGGVNGQAGSFGILNAPGFTLFAVYTLPAEFDAVRYLIGNDTGTAYTLDGMSCAPSAAMGALGNGRGWGRPGDSFEWIGPNARANLPQFVIPQDAAGVELLPTPVTFGNGGLDVAIGDQLTSSTRSVVLPGGVAPNGTLSGSIDWTFSDWAAVESLPRTDGGALPLLFLRMSFVNGH
ncbi:hypothetical protein, partial [Rhodoplanes sp. SY1]|uniref:hypothetical protein n=1 Tax=Rhodoplanes sp. SY1 TaxID=3166646 RepID=UPI0038B44B3E